MKSEAFANDIYVYQAMASHNFLNANQFLKLLQSVTEFQNTYTFHIFSIKVDNGYPPRNSGRGNKSFKFYFKIVN